MRRTARMHRLAGEGEGRVIALDERVEPLEFTERRFLIVAHLPEPEPPPADPFTGRQIRPAASRIVL